MTTLRLPEGNNVILEAFLSLGKENTPNPAEFVHQYEQHFVTAIPTKEAGNRTFERFSVIDPNIQTVVKSTTSMV